MSSAAGRGGFSRKLATLNPLAVPTVKGVPFSMYPNPATSVLNISTKNGIALENVQILDINGRVVNQTNTTASENVQINISNLNSGVYFVKIQSELGVGTSKFIKN